MNLSPFPLSLLISSPFPHSLSISSSFPHSLFISSQPGCKAATIRAALNEVKFCIPLRDSSTKKAIKIASVVAGVIFPAPRKILFSEPCDALEKS